MTFTLYRSDVLDVFSSKQTPVYDVFYYLDSDVNYDSSAQYKLPDNWQFVELDNDFNYLISDAGEVIDGRSIMHDKIKNRPFVTYAKNGRVEALYFNKDD